jgi:hypothetical protein
VKIFQSPVDPMKHRVITHKNLDYGIQKGMIYLLFPTQMQIGQVALMIEEVQVEQLSTWVSVWYPG